MSKKVRIKVPVEIVVRDRDVRVLGMLALHAAHPDAPVSVGLRLLADAMGTSPDTTRRALRSCVEEGYLTMRTNRLENGGQTENVYRITSRGRSVLDAARAAGVVE